jgi:hypothetical protein
MKAIILGVSFTIAAAVASGVSVRAAAWQAPDKPAHVSSVKLAGCLELDSQVSSVSARTAFDITAFRLVGVNAEQLRNAGTSFGFDTQGATVVRLHRQCDLDFLDHQHRIVEVEGRLIDEGPEIRKFTVVTSQGVIGWTPAIEVESYSVHGPCR